MHRFSAFGRGTRQHDRESSENRYSINNGKKGKIKLPCYSLLQKLYRLHVKINSDLFPIDSLQIVEHGATFFHAGLNVIVPRLTKFYEKIVQKISVFSDKLCYKAKAFVAKDN